MDIRAQLLVTHSRANADLVLAFVLAKQARLPKLMDAFFSGEKDVMNRAAMVVGDLGRKKPDWLLPYHARLITYADAYPHPAVPRNVLRYFSELPLGKVKEEDQGPLLDVAFRLTAGPEIPVGIRVFGMTIVAAFCVPYPELRDELRGIIELTIAEGTTPGFWSRGGKVLRWLEKG